MLAPLLALALVALTPSFDEWSVQNGRTYSPTEVSLRRKIYSQNLVKIATHNLSNATWKMGVNKFADLTAAEFGALYTGGFRAPVPTHRNLRSQPQSSACAFTVSQQMLCNGDGAGVVYNVTSLLECQNNCCRSSECAAVQYDSTLNACVPFVRLSTMVPSGTNDVCATRTGFNANPASVDWTTKGAVTPVKDQGQCGSCWAFSTTGSTEGAWFLAKKALVSLSEQQLVDCSTAEGNQGCNGGLMDYGFQYIIDNKGITTEAAYPYTSGGGTSGTCQTGKPVAVTITNFTDVTVNSEVALETAIVKQPVSVAVEADQDVFQFYTSGVMTGTCGTALDHGVLAVGYGTDATGGEFYKVKNSWGASWGEAGYIRLGRGAKFNPSGQCGIQMVASFPSV